MSRLATDCPLADWSLQRPVQRVLLVTLLAPAALLQAPQPLHAQDDPAAATAVLSADQWQEIDESIARALEWLVVS